MHDTARIKLPFEVWALVAGGFTVALGYGVVAPAIPQFALEFGVSTFAASAIVSAFALMRLLSAPLAGWIVGKFGERRTYTVGILIVAGSTGAAALAANYAQFIVLRGIGGIGSTMFTVAATALLIKVSPPLARGRVASLNAAGFLLGGLLGPVFGGIVAGFGLRAPFVFYFVMLLIAATVVAIALRRSHVAGHPGTLGTDELSMTLSTALGMPQYRTLLMSVFSFGWASFGVRVSLIPIFVAVVFHGNAATAAWILAAYAAGNAVLIFPSGRWSDTLGRKPMLIIGMITLTVTYLAFPAAPNLWIAAGVMFLAGAGSALVNPAQQAVLADVLAQRRGGNVVATYSMTSDLGGVLGPLIAGAIVDWAGFGWAFGLTAALLAVAGIAWSLVPDSRNLGAQP
ncbi:MFS transporter [Leucobacter luti]|uniref:Putative MFS family arabinose efflux permease n=1 Tax=Leucobacter luti TaxID=340320 RepID=A0A4R6RW42_9MICO|nr:MFS transporter [Leucobacter luti]MCW2288087.1 MFS family permease [Leucobacter luti]QYM75929.1 MFS transporter [Leucobacter luti]TCK45751.1 putative MFS family arabinose efflux permease [Leucobacter luti]TDP90356.1 putative MFS family arabinose efflux permease [Leucobacter luti]